MTSMTPRVIDISHWNAGPLKGGAIDFSLVANAGIWGVICKASEGVGSSDPTYASRRPAIKAAGLLHGAYHFNTGGSVNSQVDQFFRAAQPDDTTCMVIDYEEQMNKSLGNMSIQQLVEMCHQIETKLGRKAAIYSGNWLKERIGPLSASDRSYICSHRLWLAQYGAHATLPAGFKEWWLWQYTGDGFGQPPHSISGVKGNGVDLNTFAGTREELIASWSGGTAVSAAPAPAPSQPKPVVITGTVTAKSLNLRAKADATSAIVGTLVQGTPVIIRGAVMNGTTEWLDIGNGFVAARYVNVGA